MALQKPPSLLPPGGYTWKDVSLPPVWCGIAHKGNLMPSTFTVQIKSTALGPDFISFPLFFQAWHVRMPNMNLGG